MPSCATTNVIPENPHGLKQTDVAYPLFVRMPRTIVPRQTNRLKKPRLRHEYTHCFRGATEKLAGGGITPPGLVVPFDLTNIGGLKTVLDEGKRSLLSQPDAYELQARLDAASELRAAFEPLTPGRRKSYIFHVSDAKQAKTRAGGRRGVSQ